MRIAGILIALVLCAGILTAGENKTITIGERKIAVPTPKAAKFRQDFYEERKAARSSSKSPFTFDLSFVHSAPHTHVTFAFYHVSHMDNIPGIEKITFTTFRVFVDEIKRTMEDEKARDAFVLAAGRKFAEKNAGETVDIEAFSMEDAGTYYGNSVIFTSESGERHIESSLYFFHDGVIYRLSIDDFNSKSKEDSFDKLVQWMLAFLDANR